MNLFRYKTTLTLSLLLLAGTMASARGNHPATGEIPKFQQTDGLDFVENKGQWVPEAKFKASVPGGSLFITNSGFVYNYMSLDDLERVHELSHTTDMMTLNKEIIHTHAYRVNFVGGNTNVSYEQSAKRKQYHNYFLGNDPSKWAGNVGLYGKVVQKNIYSGVDVAMYGKEHSLKYDFLVAPGADPSRIKLSFEGVSPVLTDKGNLKITTSVNVLEEQAPYTYQVINGVKKEIKSRYHLEKGILTYEFPEGYDNRYELIIDPVLVFSTYSGSTTAAYSHTTTYDLDGNLYAGAYVSAIGWPATLGAAQGAPGGFSDAGINKYNATGSALLYSTYYGGSNNDFPHAMFVNDNGELILAGITSSNNIPLTATAFDNTLGGGNDIFVVHFNNTGTAMLGATYLGGSGTEPPTIDINGTSGNLNSANNLVSPVELNVDASGNIWVVSNTTSTDFPVSANAQQATSGGANDGTISKLNPACSQLLYSSYLGGSGVDAVFAIQFNSAGNAVVCGSTQSTNFPTTTGAMVTTAPGGCDGFVTIINSTTGALLHSTFTGTTGTDQAVNLQIDGSDNVYVLGRTGGDYPISAGVYSMAGSDCFIDKLNSTLSTSLLSTRVGGPQTGSRYFPTAFLLDICQNIYVAGLSQNTGGYIAGLPTTANAFDNTPRSFWFCVLEPNFSNPLMQSYFGSNNPAQNYYDHTHVGVNRLDPGGIIYHSVCANAPTGSFPTSPGAVFPTKLNQGQDILSFKFNFEATGVQSNFVLDPALSQNDTGCAPYTINLKNTSSAAKNYTWDFGDGTPVSNDTNVVHTYMNPGTYTVTLYANNDSSCITDDTAYMTITVLFTELPDIVVRDTTLCSFQQSINIGVDINNPSPNNTILWGPNTGIIGAVDQPVITVDPSANNVYWVTVKDTIPGICGFSATDTVHIDLSPRVLDIINNDTVVCEGATIPINAVGTPGYTYLWSPSTGVSDSTALQPSITIHQPNLYTLTASYPNCPDTSVQINFDMHYIPSLDLGPDKSVCQWTEVALESTITPFRNDYIYQWSPATPNLSNPTGPNTSFISDTTITYTLHVQTPIGCSDLDTIRILVYPGAFGAISPDTGYCPGNETALWATGGVSYSWTPAYGLSDTTIPNPVASPLTTTDYTVYIKDIHSCSDTERVTVQVYPEAVLTLPDSVTVYPGEQYHVEPGTNCLYFSWFPPSGLSSTNISDPLMSPQVRTRYFVNAVTENGCKISDSMDVLVKETVIDMPNAFAPAGSTPLFKPSKRGIAQLKSFTIFNRWGNKVYSSANIDEGWDGTKDGKAQPMGVYIYIIEAVTDSGKTFTKQGNVTLVR